MPPTGSANFHFCDPFGFRAYIDARFQPTYVTPLRPTSAAVVTLFGETTKFHFGVPVAGSYPYRTPPAPVVHVWVATVPSGATAGWLPSPSTVNPGLPSSLTARKWWFAWK